MAKPGDLNAEVLAATELSGSLLQFAFTVTTTAKPLVTNPTEVNWVYFQAFRSNPSFVMWGGSNLSTSGANRGPEVGPSGETPLIKIFDLSNLYVISESGEQTIFVVAGRRN